MSKDAKDVIRCIAEFLEAWGRPVNRTQIAKILGVSKRHVQQCLNATPEPKAAAPVLSRPVTIYDSATDNAGRPGTFADFLSLCLQTRETVERMRKMSPDGAKQMKRTLPAATISGQFEPTRSVANLRSHSGRVCLDCDNVTDCGALRTLLASMDCVAYCSRSVSGRGVFAVVAIAYPERHAEQYESLRRIFTRRGYEIDSQCKDVTRLRFVSYDPGARFRREPALFRGLADPAGAKLTKDHATASTPTVNARSVAASATDDDLRRAEILCGEIVNSGINLTENYNDWVEMGFALADFGEAGRELFHAVSSVSG